LQVGPVSKTLRVFGRRFWQVTGRKFRLSAPEQFDRVPLTYELAFGGVDTKAQARDARGPVSEPRNPIGTGFAVNERDLAGTLACAVEHPTSLISSPKDRPQPAGFGPIARHWSPRVELAGTYDQAWDESRRPLLPVDFQDRFY